MRIGYHPQLQFGTSKSPIKRAEPGLTNSDSDSGTDVAHLHELSPEFRAALALSRQVLAYFQAEFKKGSIQYKDCVSISRRARKGCELPPDPGILFQMNGKNYVMSCVVKDSDYGRYWRAKLGAEDDSVQLDYEYQPGFPQGRIFYTASKDGQTQIIDPLNINMHHCQKNAGKPFPDPTLRQKTETLMRDLAAAITQSVLQQGHPRALLPAQSLFDCEGKDGTLTG